MGTETSQRNIYPAGITDPLLPSSSTYNNCKEKPPIDHQGNIHTLLPTINAASLFGSPPSTTTTPTTTSSTPQNNENNNNTLLQSINNNNNPPKSANDISTPPPVHVAPMFRASYQQQYTGAYELIRANVTGELAHIIHSLRHEGKEKEELAAVEVHEIIL